MWFNNTHYKELEKLFKGTVEGYCFVNSYIYHFIWTESFKLIQWSCSFPIFILDFAYLAITSLRFLLWAESVNVAGLPRFIFALDDMLYYCTDIRSSLRLYEHERVRNRFFVTDIYSWTLVSSKKSLTIDIDIKSYIFFKSNYWRHISLIKVKCIF